MGMSVSSQKARAPAGSAPHALLHCSAAPSQRQCVTPRDGGGTLGGSQLQLQVGVGCFTAPVADALCWSSLHQVGLGRPEGLGPVSP